MVTQDISSSEDGTLGTEIGVIVKELLLTNIKIKELKAKERKLRLQIQEYSLNEDKKKFDKLSDLGTVTLSRQPPKFIKKACGKNFSGLSEHQRGELLANQLLQAKEEVLLNEQILEMPTAAIQKLVDDGILRKEMRYTASKFVESIDNEELIHDLIKEGLMSRSHVQATVREK